MDVHELTAAGAPRAEGVEFDGAGLTEAVEDCFEFLVGLLGQGNIHQAVDGVADQRDARPQDVEARQQRDDRVESRLLGDGDQRNPQQHRRRSDDVGEQVFPVREKGRRSGLTALAQQQVSDHAVDDRGDHRDHQAQTEPLQRTRIDQALDRRCDDEGRSDEDHHAFDDRAEVLGLAVAVGVVVVRGLDADLERDKGDDGSDQVYQ